MSRREPLPPLFVSSPFTVWRALEQGIPPTRLRARDLAHPFWGVRTDARRCLALIASAEALAVRMPPYAFFSHATAAALLGMPLPPSMAASPILHVSVPAPARAPHARGIHGHTLRLHPTDLAARYGLRLTSPARTWSDLASALELPDLVAAGDFLLSGPAAIATFADLSTAAERRAGARGVRRQTIALPLLSAFAESPQESRLRILIHQAGLPAPSVNFELRGSDGRFMARIDLAFEQYRLGIEYEGDHHRTDARQWHRDIDRVSGMEDIDWRIMRVTAQHMRRPDDLTDRIAGILRSRGWH